MSVRENFVPNEKVECNEDETDRTSQQEIDNADDYKLRDSFELKGNIRLPSFNPINYMDAADAGEDVPNAREGRVD